MSLKFTIAEFGSDLHQQSIVLRDNLLRKPLGLKFTDIELALEMDQYHLVGTLDEKVIAVCLLQPLNKFQIKLRQFGVAEEHQKDGVGKKLVHFAECIAGKESFAEVVLHARKSVVSFYAKCGYQVKGDEFEEVGIPHSKMLKVLSQTS